MLQPQTSRDLELGARWAYASGKAEVRLYRSLLDNEIGFDPNAAGPFGFPGRQRQLRPDPPAGPGTGRRACADAHRWACA